MNDYTPATDPKTGEESDLVTDPQEIPNHIAAGRTWPSLKESKSLDTQRLNESPLFKDQGRLF